MPQPERLMWRSDFGWSRHSPATPADPKKGLVVHYDGSDQRLASKDHSACIAYWRWCRAFHTGPARGWADLGYSFGCCPHSYVMEGRGLFRTQAAQPGGNTTYYSVTLMCGPNDEITPGQINAVRQLREWLMEPATSIAGTVKGHRDFVSTSCPGDTLSRRVRHGGYSQPAVGGGRVPSAPRMAHGTGHVDRRNRQGPAGLREPVLARRQAVPDGPRRSLLPTRGVGWWRAGPVPAHREAEADTEVGEPRARHGSRTQ